MNRRALRWTLRIIALGAGLILAFILWRWSGGNLGTVQNGKLYRSAQLSGGKLATVIQSRSIRTVLNLRGQNLDQKWYQAERSATLAAGATQVDFPMASDQWLSRNQVGTLVEILDRSEPPLLIHCEWGAERTGLVAAIAELLRPGSTLADGLRQFSAYYLFLPIKDGRVMRGHLDQYARWLENHHEEHSPERFRRWLASAYDPGSPSREFWPCDPYALKIVSRSSGTQEASWSKNRCVR